MQIHSLTQSRCQDKVSLSLKGKQSEVKQQVYLQENQLWHMWKVIKKETLVAHKANIHKIHPVGMVGKFKISYFQCL